MSRLLPLPTDLFKKVDAMLVTVEGTLERVDGTLGTVESTLGDVRELLVELKDELELLHQVPALAAQLDDVHRIVTELAKKSRGSKAG